MKKPSVLSIATVSRCDTRSTPDSTDSPISARIGSGSVLHSFFIFHFFFHSGRVDTTDLIPFHLKFIGTCMQLHSR